MVLLSSGDKLGWRIAILWKMPYKDYSRTSNNRPWLGPKKSVGFQRFRFWEIPEVLTFQHQFNSFTRNNVNFKMILKYLHSQFIANGIDLILFTRLTIKFVWSVINNIFDLLNFLFLQKLFEITSIKTCFRLIIITHTLYAHTLSNSYIVFNTL